MQLRFRINLSREKLHSEKKINYHENVTFPQHLPKCHHNTYWMNKSRHFPFVPFAQPDIHSLNWNAVYAKVLFLVLLPLLSTTLLLLLLLSCVEYVTTTPVRRICLHSNHLRFVSFCRAVLLFLYALKQMNWVCVSARTFPIYVHGLTNPNDDIVYWCRTR